MGIALIGFGIVLGLYGVMGVVATPQPAGQVIMAILFLAGVILLAAGCVVLTIQKLHTTVALAATAANKARG